MSNNDREKTMIRKPAVTTALLCLAMLACAQSASAEERGSTGPAVPEIKAIKEIDTGVPRVWQLGFVDSRKAIAVTETWILRGSGETLFFDVASGKKVLSLASPTVALEDEDLRHLFVERWAQHPSLVRERSPREFSVWRAGQYKPVGHIALSSKWAWIWQLSPDASVLGVADTDATLRFYDVATGKKLSDCKTRAWDFEFPIDGKRAAVHGAGAIRVFDVSTGAELSVLKDSLETPAFIRYSRNGRIIAAGYGKEHRWKVRIWDAASGEKLRDVDAGLSNEVSVAFSPGNDHLAIASTMALKLIEIASGREVAHTTTRMNPALVDWSKDNRIAWVVSDDTMRTAKVIVGVPPDDGNRAPIKKR